MSFHPRMDSRIEGFTPLEPLRWRGWAGAVADIWTVACAENAGGRYVSPNSRLFVMLEGAASGAIWLAEGTPYLPTDGWERAQALSWMFFEQYSHEPCVAVARFIRGWTDADSPRRAELPRLHERAATALAVMEQHLRQAQWFTGSGYGIADIALFAYTDVAADGGIDLQPFVEVRAWLQRVREQPRFVAMPAVTPEVRARLDARG